MDRLHVVEIDGISPSLSLTLAILNNVCMHLHAITLHPCTISLLVRDICKEKKQDGKEN